MGCIWSRVQNTNNEPPHSLERSGSVKSSNTYVDMNNFRIQKNVSSYSLETSGSSNSSDTYVEMNGCINYIPSEVIPDSDPPIIYERPDIEFTKDGKVASASLDGLIEVLHWTTVKPMKSYVFPFLLCARFHIEPYDLLDMVYKRFLKSDCVVVADPGTATEAMHKEVAEMRAFIQILKQWTTMFPNDFLIDNVMNLLKEIGARCLAKHMAPVQLEMTTVLQNLVPRIREIRNYRNSLMDVVPVTHVDQLPMGDIITLGLSPAEIAQELSTIELYKLSFVGPEEIMQDIIGGAKTECLQAYINWTNRLTDLVATDILKSGKNKYRAQVIEKWVMTARECFFLGNFNSMMAILGGLNKPPVKRLKKTWSRISTSCDQQLDRLQLCIEPMQNHFRYRFALVRSPERSRVAMLSITLRDMNFVYQATRTMLPDNRINFVKYMELASRVDTLFPSRQLMYTGCYAPPDPPRRDTPVWRFLTCRPTLTEHAMDLTTYECEPPVNKHEKERLKLLRVAA